MHVFMYLTSARDEKLSKTFVFCARYVHIYLHIYTFVYAFTCRKLYSSYVQTNCKIKTKVVQVCVFQFIQCALILDRLSKVTMWSSWSWSWSICRHSSLNTLHIYNITVAHAVLLYIHTNEYRLYTCTYIYIYLFIY